MIRALINCLKRFRSTETNKILLKNGSGNIIENLGSLHQVNYDITGNNNLIKIGKNCVISNFRFYIKGNNHRILIGENCRIKGGDCWLEDDDGEINIGKNTTIESAHLAVTETSRKIEIGEDCMFSYGIEVRTGDSHSIIDRESGKRINFAKDITISDHVWVGAKATILKGCKIGKNSIISTGAIVTKDVTANTIVAGVPAKTVKTNINWLRERIDK